MIDPDVRRFYDVAPEESRLDRPNLEILRTRDLLVRFLPDAPAVVYDIGGGAGVYAFWLAERGYDVHLLDASPRLVEEARRRDDGAKAGLASIREGDACALPYQDESADAAMLLGPLYHLTEGRDRQLALREALRVVKPGGIVIAAAISRYASALQGMAMDRTDPAFHAIVERDLADGQHRNPTGELEYFTTAYFHRPEDLRQDAREAGIRDPMVLAIEGPGWLLTDLADRLADDRKRDDLLRVARRLESEPSLLGTSAHLLVVGRREAEDP